MLLTKMSQKKHDIFVAFLSLTHTY